MGSANRKQETFALIDTGVTVSGGLSHIWDTWAIVGIMVASQLPTMAKEAFQSVTEIALATIHIVDYEAPDASRPGGMVQAADPLRT